MKTPKISIEKENDPSVTWFKRHLYRKEGGKYVLDTKRYTFVFVAIALFAVLMVSLQPVPNQKTTTSNEVYNTFNDASLYQFPELAKVLSEEPSTKPSGTGNKHKRSGPQVISRPKIAIPPATNLPAVLLTGASDGIVRARVIQAVSVNGEVAIEEGSILTGQATSTEDRLLITFNKLIDKDGGIRTIQAQAYDKKDNLAGIAGAKLKNNTLKFLGGVGLNFLGSMSEGLQDREGQQGVVVKKSSIKNALLEGTSRTALDQSREIMSDLKNNRPQVRLDEGVEILIFFES